MTDMDTSGFDLFTNLMDQEATTPTLEDGKWYPAVLVSGPTTQDMKTDLLFNTKPDPKRNGLPKNTMTFRWQLVVGYNPDDDLDFSDRAFIYPLKYYTYMARVVAVPGKSEDEMKDLFLSGKATIDGSTAGNLRTLRSVLFTDQEILDMGNSYQFDRFYGRVFRVEIRHKPHFDEVKAAMGEKLPNITRLARRQDELSGGIATIDRADINWQPREENNEYDLG